MRAYNLMINIIIRKKQVIKLKYYSDLLSKLHRQSRNIVRK